MSIKNTIKLAMNWIKSNPQILITGLGIAASVATAITSGKAPPRPSPMTTACPTTCSISPSATG